MQPLIGQVALFPYDFVPQGWVACEGQVLNIPEHMPLFSLVGNAHGGDGRLTFGLPDLSGQSPAPGLRYCMALAGDFPVKGQA